MPAIKWITTDGKMSVTTITGLLIEYGREYLTRDGRKCVYDYISTGRCTAYIDGFFIEYDLVDQHICGRESGLDVVGYWKPETP